MNRLTPFLALLLVAAAAGPLLAATSPRPGQTDPRIRWLAYNEREVIEVMGHYGYQTMVAFGAAEEITDISLGE